MSDQKKISEALLQAQKESKNSPNEETGCCTISTKGWSEQKHHITKAACDKQKGTGVTVDWNKGDC